MLRSTSAGLTHSLMFESMITREYIRECKLDDGSICEYKECLSVNEDPQKHKINFEYIGTGVIYMINGVLQDDKERYYFYG